MVSRSPSIRRGKKRRKEGRKERRMKEKKNKMESRCFNNILKRDIVQCRGRYTKCHLLRSVDASVSA